MKSNPDKCHSLVSTNDNVKIRIGNFQIENTNREKLLGIQFDNKLSFNYHLSAAGTIVRDPHHSQSPTRREQDLNLRRTLVQALLNKVVQW